ncbi:hypothetical protein HDV04_006195 [Boothiomyces sp. JEL0838]|nr:hypothetical protein HDV04_006195 [Boothiomyces sp. JEL0838]
MVIYNPLLPDVLPHKNNPQSKSAMYAMFLCMELGLGLLLSTIIYCLPNINVMYINMPKKAYWSLHPEEYKAHLPRIQYYMSYLVPCVAQLLFSSMWLYFDSIVQNDGRIMYIFIFILVLLSEIGTVYYFLNKLPDSRSQLPATLNNQPKELLFSIVIGLDILLALLVGILIHRMPFIPIQYINIPNKLYWKNNPEEYKENLPRIQYLLSYLITFTGQVLFSFLWLYCDSFLNPFNTYDYIFIFLVFAIEILVIYWKLFQLPPKATIIIIAD